MKVLLALAGLLALAAASDSYEKKEEHKEPEPAYPAAGAYTYHGKYPGKCGSDGLYFRDAKSFVFCSNGNSYVQPCAPGSRNSAYGKYNDGDKYNYRDFCDVNLVDGGYAAEHASYGSGYGYDYAHYGPSYGYAHRAYSAGRPYGYGPW